MSSLPGRARLGGLPLHPELDVVLLPVGRLSRRLARGALLARRLERVDRLLRGARGLVVRLRRGPAGVGPGPRLLPPLRTRSLLEIAKPLRLGRHARTSTGGRMITVRGAHAPRKRTCAAPPTGYSNPCRGPVGARPGHRSLARFPSCPRCPPVYSHFVSAPRCTRRGSVAFTITRRGDPGRRLKGVLDARRLRLRRRTGRRLRLRRRTGRRLR